MKRNKKLFIAAISSLLVMVMAVTAITFSLADNKQNPASGNVEVMFGGVETALTNIDYIIKTSQDSASKNYRVVEIGPGATSNSSFGAFVSENGTKSDFRTYVIDGNKSSAMPDNMADGKLEYRYYQAAAVTDDNEEALQYISGADLIYISNNTDATYSPANKTDINEELYNLLHVYAVGEYKPIIIDSPTVGSGEEQINTGMSFADLVKKYYGKQGAAYNVFKWNSEAGALIDAEKFLNGGLTSQYSYYRAINGNSRSAYWTNVINGSATGEMAEILVVNNTGTSLVAGTMSGNLFAGASTVSGLKDANSNEAVSLASNQVTLDVSNNTSFYNRAYSTKYNAKPEYVRVTTVNITSITAAELDMDKYDMIVFESSCNNISGIDSEVSKKLIAAMYAGNHIAYDPTNLSADNNNITSGTVTNSSNFNEIFYMVATDKEVARFSNVLVTNKGKMDLITSSKSAGTCKQIADIINGGSFRGIGGPSSTSSMFTVLEIQPCYPIDEKLANALGGKYYEKPSELSDGKTAEQLGYTYEGDDVFLNGTKVTNSTTNAIEYYKWELSEANVAEALNMDASQVRVVHMSSKELASSKVEILGNYDMVYIGGNYSARFDATGYKSFASMREWGVNDRAGNVVTNADYLKRLPIYVMYAHNGDFVYVQSDGEANSNPNKISCLSVITDYTQAASTTFGLANGNDLTYDTLEELKKYVNAGLPVVISSDVTVAYNTVYDGTDKANNWTRKEEAYLQNGIDPDSNMAKFLDHCKRASLDGTLGTNGVAGGKKNTILWNFNPRSTALVDNDGGVLGDTSTGYVSVFVNESDTLKHRDNFRNVFANSNQRAKLSVTEMPTVYNLYDPTTKLPNGSKLNFKYDVVGANNYEVKVYADYNLDSTFSEDELIGGPSSSTTITADVSSNSKFGEDFYGPVYWKLELTDKDTGTQVCTTNIAYIKAPANTPKKPINVLQIIPCVPGTDKPATGNQAYTNLLFCTRCQRNLNRLTYNPGGNNRNYLDNGQWDFSFYYEQFGNVGEDKLDSNHKFLGTYTGLHEHEFGIVKYDSTMSYGDDKVGVDLWDVNLADEVSDLYDFDIDILTSRELEAMSKEVYDIATSKLATYGYSGKTLETLDADEIKAFKTSLSGELGSLALALSDAEQREKNAETALVKELEQMIKEAKAAGDNKAANAFQRMIDERYYEDYLIYVQNPISYNPSGYPYWHYDTFRANYESFARAKDAKLEAEKAYDKANRVAHYDNWIYDCYQCMIIGPAENFGGDDIKDTRTLDDIEKYILSDGNVILFHSTLSNYSRVANDPTTTGPVYLSNRLKSLVGMDKNHLQVDSKNYHSGDYYIPYTAATVDNVDGTQTVYSKDKYYFMNLSYKPSTDNSRYSSWWNDFVGAGYVSSNGTNPKYLSNVAYTDIMWTAISNYTGSAQTFYKYSKYNYIGARNWAHSEAEISRHGTDRAAQVNKGIITYYPFTLSDKLNISGTHGQAYALDIENSDSTVWYTFGGGTLAKDESSIYAADPKNGADGYFMYSYGSVFYCGAGHSEITGYKKDNNDERRLYLNVICNSVTNESTASLNIYDYNQKGDNITIKTDGDDYLYKIGEEVEYPQFSFVGTASKGASINGVKIFYDVDGDGVFNTTAGDKLIQEFRTEKDANGKSVQGFYYYDEATKKYVLIKEYKSGIKSGEMINVPELNSTLNSLKLDPNTLINSRYTYIVVQITDSNNKVRTKRIRIEVNYNLYDMT